MAYICHAIYSFDVTNQQDVIEIEYTKFIPGLGWKTHTDFIDTYPEGDWTSLTFPEHSLLKYVDFLNTMVHKNLEVARKIAKLSLDNISTKNPRKLIRIVNAIKILDTTFIPPIFNIECSWQVELIEHMALTTSYRIIATCKNKKRLDTYSRVVQLV